MILGWKDLLSVLVCCPAGMLIGFWIMSERTLESLFEPLTEAEFWGNAIIFSILVLVIVAVYRWLVRYGEEEK